MTTDLPSLDWLVRHPTADLERFGRQLDGGYVVPRRALDAAGCLIALGINDEWSFESDVLTRTKVRKMMAVDGSVGLYRFLRLAFHHGRMAVGAGLAWRWSAARTHRAWAVQYLRTARGFRALLAPAGRTFVRRMLRGAPADDAVTWRVLAADRTAAEAQLFIKMDIEGAEYEVLPAILADADRITGLVIEFHEVGSKWAHFRSLLEALTGPFAVVHVHGNNWVPLVPGTTVPDVLEVTLLRRRLMTAEELNSVASDPLPLVGLDWPNNPQADDYALVTGQ